jgi:predicted RNA-binding protein associated with RNAse of E/G family
MPFKKHKEIEKLYEQGQIPEPEEMRGEYFVVVPWFPWLSLAALKHRKAVEQDNEGDNVVGGGFRFGHFTLRKEDNALLIDYDNEDNPQIMRGVVDRIRRVPDGRLVGKLNYRVFGDEIFILYFEMRPKTD